MAGGALGSVVAVTLLGSGLKGKGSGKKASNNIEQSKEESKQLAEEPKPSADEKQVIGEEITPVDKSQLVDVSKLIVAQLQSSDILQPVEKSHSTDDLKQSVDEKMLSVEESKTVEDQSTWEIIRKVKPIVDPEIELPPIAVSRPQIILDPLPTLPTLIEPAANKPPVAAIVWGNYVGGDDGIISKLETEGKVLLSGAYDLKGVESPAMITVLVGNSPRFANFDNETKTWWLEVDAESLISKGEGERELVATISAMKNMGVDPKTGRKLPPLTTMASAKLKYIVDTVAQAPEILFDKITGDDWLSFTEQEIEKTTISGSVKYAREGDFVKLEIGQSIYYAEVKNGRFSKAVNTKNLIVHEKVSASIETLNVSGDMARGAEETYVNVEEIPLTIKLHPVTDDNIINISESGKVITLSGSVTRAEDGSKVELTIGNQILQTQVNNGEFSLQTSGQLLAKNNKISAIVKNTENMTANIEYVYETALDKPTITLNPITRDNKIDSIEAMQPMTAITGYVTGAVDGSEVEVSCGCPYCTRANWNSVKTKVVGGAFKVEFATSILTAENHKMIRAKVLATDKAGNVGEAETSKIYQIISTENNDASLSHLPPVGERNVFNKAFVEKTQTFVYRGTVWGISIIQDKERVEKVEIKLNGKTFSTKLSKSTSNNVLREFETELHVADFANGSEMYVVATVVNKETGKLSTISEKVSYRYDLDAKITVGIDPIHNGKTVVAADLNKNTIVTGTLIYDNADFNQQDIKAKLMLNGKEYFANVLDKAWSLMLPMTELAVGDGQNSLSVKVEAKDLVGNLATSESMVTYQVAISPPMPVITLNPIGEHNVVAKNESKPISVSGRVSGDFVVGENVTIALNGKVFEAMIQDGGIFSLNIKAADLVNSSSSIIVSYSTKDIAGNVGSAQASLAYSVSQGDIRIHLNEVTTDNLINVTEQFEMIELSGSISGGIATTSAVVEITINGQVHQAALENDLTFKLYVTASELLKTANYTLNAKVTVDEHVATTAKTFLVDPSVAAQIDLVSLGDFAISLADKNPITRIFGEVEFDGIYAQGKNYNEVRQAIVTIGNKDYRVGVHNKTFFVDIAVSELKGLNGQAVSVKFTPNPKIYYLTQREGIYDRHYVDSPEVGTKSITLKGDYLKVTNKDNYSIAYQEDMIMVKGNVSGTAKPGDKVILTVGDKVITTEVLEDYTFSVSVSKQILSTTDRVQATLETKDLSGQKIQVFDQEVYWVAQDLTGEKKIGLIPVPKNIQDDHSKEEWNTAYFVNRLGGFGKTYNIPFGSPQEKPAVIKYYFHGSEQLEFETGGNIPRDALQDVRLKEIFREVYDQYSSYLNVEFVESKVVPVTDRQSLVINFGKMANGSAAVAASGGNITWNASNDYKSWGEDYSYYTALHEIGHTLGMPHTDATTEFGKDYLIEDSSEFSVMSYKRYVNDSLYQKLHSLRMYDLAYLQNRFGVNPKSRAGDDIYSFANFNTYAADGGRYIWDGAGVDTFDASKEQDGVYVNLNPGSWIYVGDTKEKYFVIKKFHSNTQDVKAYFGLPDKATVDSNGTVDAPLNIPNIEYTKGQAYIGQGTQIENLLGSAHNDTLIGNTADNHIYGGTGDDNIEGGAGNDYLDGGLGVDILKGGSGDDIYFVDSEDIVIEEVAQGTDMIYSTSNNRLTEHVEHLVLVGTTAISAEGNSQNNTLIANNIGNILNGRAGDDRLVGGLGADTLVGGEGADTFVFNSILNGQIDIITDFEVGDKIELSKAIFTSLTSQDRLAEHIQYDLTTGKLSYDRDGNGKEDAIHFATLKSPFTALDNSALIIA